MSLAIRPKQRQEGVSFICHLAEVNTYFAHHRAHVRFVRSYCE